MRTVDLPYTRRARNLALGLAALAVAGCQLGPQPVAPDMALPARYGVESAPAAAGAPGAVQHFTLGERPVPAWWTAYGSPTLSAWVDEALAHNYSLSQANHSLAGAREQLRSQVGASTLPTLDAALQSNRQRALGLPTMGPQTNLYNTFAGQLRASYTFDLFGAARYANSALAAQVDAQSYQRDAARRAVAANLVIAAINGAALRAQIDATERLVALADADSADVRRRMALGGAARGEVLNAEASAEALRAGLPGLRTQWQAARHALAVLMGRMPDAAPPDLDLTALALPENVPLAVPSALLRQRPDILAADATLRAAAAQASQAVAELYPNLSISASYGRSGYDWSQATAAGGAVWGLGASLTQPLFHGGALRAKRRAAQEAFEASQDNYRQTVLNAFQNVADSLGALTHDASAQQAAASARERSEQFWRDAGRRGELGAIAQGAVRAGERQFQNARLTEIRTVAARLADTATLFQAMGTPEEDGARVGQR